LQDDVETRLATFAHGLARKDDVDDAMMPDHFPANEDDDAATSTHAFNTLQELRSLFSNCRFFLNREVPKQALTVAIR
jgi:hypothetical protein